MAKALITTRFPTTSEVARKLGVPDSRIRHVRALMNLSAVGHESTAAKALKKALRRPGAKKSNPSTRQK